jgi:hypothetical protein
LCQIINCKVAFKKQFNGKKYNWIQLAGHAGRFKPGDREGFILKLMDNLERKCLEILQNDGLADFVPKIDKILFDYEDAKCKFLNENNVLLFHPKSFILIFVNLVVRLHGNAGFALWL